MKSPKFRRMTFATYALAGVFAVLFAHALQQVIEHPAGEWQPLVAGLFAAAAVAIWAVCALEAGAVHCAILVAVCSLLAIGVGLLFPTPDFVANAVALMGMGAVLWAAIFSARLSGRAVVFFAGVTLAATVGALSWWGASGARAVSDAILALGGFFGGLWAARQIAVAFMVLRSKAKAWRNRRREEAQIKAAKQSGLYDQVADDVFSDLQALQAHMAQASRAKSFENQAGVSHGQQ